MPDPLPAPADEGDLVLFGSAADRQLVETWAAAQGSALTRKSYHRQGGRLLARSACRSMLPTLRTCRRS